MANTELSDDVLLGVAKEAQIAMVITNPSLPNNPIIFSNAAFTRLTGYGSDEVIGRNCKFLQGEQTSRESISLIRNIINTQSIDTVEIINYRKDGSWFVNALQIGPIFDKHGKLAFFFGCQLDVTAKRQKEREIRELADRELVHRLGNIVNVMSAIINMTVREAEASGEVAKSIIGRLTALSNAHVKTILRPKHEILAVEELAQSILKTYAPLGEKQFKLSGPSVFLPISLISPMTFTLHELATNSVKYGALSEETGIIQFDWNERRDGECHFVNFKWSENNGPIVVPPTRHGGSKIVSALVKAAGGKIDFDWKNQGVVVDAEFPVVKTI